MIEEMVWYNKEWYGIKLEGDLSFHKFKIVCSKCKKEEAYIVDGRIPFDRINPKNILKYFKKKKWSVNNDIWLCPDCNNNRKSEVDKLKEKIAEGWHIKVYKVKENMKSSDWIENILREDYYLIDIYDYNGVLKGNMKVNRDELNKLQGVKNDKSNFMG